MLSRQDFRGCHQDRLMPVCNCQQHGVKLRAVAFGQGDWVEELDQLKGPIDIAYRPVINEFRGRRTVEMHLVDWRPAELPATVADD